MAKVAAANAKSSQYFFVSLVVIEGCPGNSSQSIEDQRKRQQAQDLVILGEAPGERETPAVMDNG